VPGGIGRAVPAPSPAVGTRGQSGVAGSGRGKAVFQGAATDDSPGPLHPRPFL